MSFPRAFLSSQVVSNYFPGLNVIPSSPGTRRFQSPAMAAGSLGWVRMKCIVSPPPHERIVRSGLASQARRNVHPSLAIPAILASNSALFPAPPARNAKYKDVLWAPGFFASSSLARLSIRKRGSITKGITSSIGKRTMRNAVACMACARRSWATVEP